MGFSELRGLSCRAKHAKTFLGSRLHVHKPHLEVSHGMVPLESNERGVAEALVAKPPVVKVRHIVRLHEPPSHYICARRHCRSDCYM